MRKKVKQERFDRLMGRHLEVGSSTRTQHQLQVVLSSSSRAKVQFVVLYLTSVMLRQAQQHVRMVRERGCEFLCLPTCSTVENETNGHRLVFTSAKVCFVKKSLQDGGRIMWQRTITRCLVARLVWNNSIFRLPRGCVILAHVDDLLFWGKRRGGTTEFEGSARH